MGVVYSYEKICVVNSSLKCVLGCVGVCRRVIKEQSDCDITSMLLQGGGLWLGTRNGYLLLLDIYSLLEGKEDTLLGIQHCGQGKVKCIVALGTASSKLQASQMGVASFVFK